MSASHSRPAAKQGHARVWQCDLHWQPGNWFRHVCREGFFPPGALGGGGGQLVAPRHACLACNHAAVASSKSGFSTCRASYHGAATARGRGGTLGTKHPQNFEQYWSACRHSQFSSVQGPSCRQ